MRHLPLLLLPVLAMALSSCSSDTVRINSGARVAKAHDAPIEILVTRKPERAYEEIALVRMETDDAKEFIEDLTERARELGGDAVIIGDRSIQAPAHWYSDYQNITQSVVIVWKEPAAAAPAAATTP